MAPALPPVYLEALDSNEEHAMGAGLRTTPDFETLVALHRHDPQSFEHTRRAMLRAAVDEAPPQHRPALEALLERIESVREQAATPQHAAEDAFRMMCDSASRLGRAWDHAHHAIADLQAALVIEQARLK